MTLQRSRGMSTDRHHIRETSFGGVVVREGEVLVITPAGKRRVTGLPKGGPNPGESGGIVDGEAPAAL